jgi:DDE superfamily endonuclease
MEPKKRSVGASERDEFLRAAWRALVVGSLDANRLVFVDEMGTNTSLAPLYAWSRRGERALFEVPRNWGANVTLLASMSAEGMGPCLAVEGSTTKAVFETYLERALAPTLRVRGWWSSWTTSRPTRDPGCARSSKGADASF